MTHVAVFTEQKRLIVWKGRGEPAEFDTPIQAGETVRQVALAADKKRVLLALHKRLVSVSTDDGSELAHRPPRPRPTYLQNDPHFFSAVAFGTGWIAGGLASAFGLTADLGVTDFSCPLEGGSFSLLVDGDSVLVGAGRGDLYRVRGKEISAHTPLPTDQPLVLLASSPKRVSGVLATNEVVTWADPLHPRSLGPLAEVLAITCDDDATYLLCGNGKLIRADEQRLDLVQEWAVPLACATTLHGEFLAADHEGHLVRMSPAHPGKVLALLPIDAGRALVMGATG